MRSLKEIHEEELEELRRELKQAKDELDRIRGTSFYDPARNALDFEKFSASQRNVIAGGFYTMFFGLLVTATYYTHAAFGSEAFWLLALLMASGWAIGNIKGSGYRKVETALVAAGLVWAAYTSYLLFLGPDQSVLAARPRPVAVTDPAAYMASHWMRTGFVVTLLALGWGFTHYLSMPARQRRPGPPPKPDPFGIREKGRKS